MYGQGLPSAISSRNLSWKTACWLYWKIVESNSNQADLFRLLRSSENADSCVDMECPIENIHKSLSGLSHSLESQLPKELKRQRSPRLIFSKKSDGQIVGVWEDDQEHNEFKIKNIILNRAKLHTELDVVDAILIAEHFLTELFDSQVVGITIPGFERISARSASEVILKLIPRTTIGI